MDKELGEKYAGLVVLGGLITGVIGLLATLFVMDNEQGDFMAAAVFLSVSALAFGLQSWAIFRK